MGLLLVLPPVALIILFVLYPALFAIYNTFQVKDGGQFVLSLQNYLTFFSDPQSRRNLFLTVWTTVITTVMLIAFCLPIAAYLRFSTGRLPTIVQSIAVFPLFVPGIIVAYALIRVIGSNGIVATVLDHLGISGYQTPYLTPWGSVIGLFWEGIPLTLLVLLSGMSQVPMAAIEAARDVGAGSMRIAVHIILPLIKNSLLIAFSLEFLAIFGSFTTPYLLGPASPEMMGVYMQRTFNDVHDPIQAQTQAVVSFVICSAIGILYVRAIGRRREAGRP